MLRPLLLFVLLLAAALGHAGSFSLENIDGGSWHYPNVGTYSYSGFTDGSYGSDRGRGDSCAGTITATLKWQADPRNPSDVAPAKVLVARGCVAVGSTCDNGLGDTPVNGRCGEDPNQVGGWVPKYHYYAADVDANGEVTVTCTPSASKSPSGAGVAFWVQATPLSLVLTGPGDASTAPKLAIGQLLAATVSGAPSDATYTWATPSAGAPFANYVASSSSATYTGWTAPATTSITMACYFAKAGSPTISCTLHSPHLDMDVTVTKSLSVEAPIRTKVFDSFGSMKLLTGAAHDQVWSTSSPYNPNGFFLWGATNPNPSAKYPATWGMYQSDKLSAPQFLLNASKGGDFCYIQLINVTNTLNGSPTYATGLDGAFPEDGPFAANGTTVGLFGDSPGYGFSVNPNSTLSYKKEGFYDLYMLYKPGDSAAGSSVYVPIYQLGWKAKGHFSYDTTVTPGTVVQADDGSQVTKPAVDYDYDKFPEW